MLVKAFLPHSAMERLAEGRIRRGARATEGSLHATPMRPGIERLRADLWAVVHLEDVGLEDVGQPTRGGQPLQDSHDPLSGERAVDLTSRTLTTPGLD